MKKFITLSACCLLLMNSCNSNDNNTFTLKGEIGDWNAPAMLYISYWYGIEEFTDSVNLHDGKFSLTGIISEPVPSRLILDYTGDGMIPAAQAGHMYYLYLEPGTVRLKSPDSLKNITFVNSPVNAEHQRYLEIIGGQIWDLSAKMNEKMAQATREQRRDTAFTNEMNREYRRMLNERNQKQQQFVRDYPNSFFSVVAISESVSQKFDVDEIEPLFLSINEKFRNTHAGRAFAQRIEAARIVAIGKKAPNFTQNDPDGHPVSLSDFSGKYVLLEFWASWCGPCRQENPNLVKAYAAHKNNGFEILGVSLDQRNGREAWLNAIEKDGLTWTQVSDLNGWNNAVARLYGVRSVPQNYLIDPKGIIVAENLKGDALQNFLKELFGK